MSEEDIGEEPVPQEEDAPEAPVDDGSYDFSPAGVPSAIDLTNHLADEDGEPVPPGVPTDAAT